MGCHFCSQELIAIFTVLAGVKYIPIWVKGVWARRHKKPCCQHDKEHDDH